MRWKNIKQSADHAYVRTGSAIYKFRLCGAAAVKRSNGDP